jgi:hypothetical protein
MKADLLEIIRHNSKISYLELQINTEQIAAGFFWHYPLIFVYQIIDQLERESNEVCFSRSAIIHLLSIQSQKRRIGHTL